MSELKPCPFCGNTEVRHVNGAPSNGHYILCSSCDAPSAMRSTPKEAAQHWNRRAPSDQPADAVVVPVGNHQFSEKETDRHLLSAYTETSYGGDYPAYFNLTMLRMKGDVVLTVRLPSSFGQPAGQTSSVRFTRTLWREFAESVNAANKVFLATDYLDSIY